MIIIINKNKKQTNIKIIKYKKMLVITNFEKLTLEDLEKILKKIPEEFVDAFWTAFSYIGGDVAFYYFASEKNIKNIFEITFDRFLDKLKGVSFDESLLFRELLEFKKEFIEKIKD